ncbi:MAG TPA: cysteine-rich CWC family protein [Caldimonas sp.]|nr:cysteine-rich CWC family protein [Caldimonas sp.]
MATRPAPSLRCPLCGGANACAPARSARFDTPCWCEGATFPAELLARIPAPLRGVACVCAACAARAGSAAPATGITGPARVGEP